MRNALKIVGCLALIAVPLPFGCPAYAQQQAGNGESTAQSQTGGTGGGAWNGECPERQELREERERIRTEHEQLESEHDTLKAQCMDAKGQDRSECTARKEDLHARMDALHERMKELHEKAMADPGCHHDHKGNGNKTPWPSRQESPNSPPSAQPPSSTQ
jgi:hypothetical protein